MRIQTSSPQSPIADDATKIREKLQAELLRRSVNQQQIEAKQVQTKQQGLGQILDIRV